MELIFLGLFFGSPLLALLAWHAWRDSRGYKRNAAGRCYACASVLQGTELPISHNKGGSYLYCSPCARSHNGLMRSVLLVAGLLLATGVMVMLANHLA